MRRGIQRSSLIQAKLRLQREREEAKALRSAFSASQNVSWLRGPLLTTADVGTLLATSPGTVNWWRWTGWGPPFVRLATYTIRYRRLDLLRWLQQQVVRPKEGK